jgi:hypothetical protein
MGEVSGRESSRADALTDAFKFEQGQGPYLGAERRSPISFELRLAQNGREKAEEKF